MEKTDLSSGVYVSTDDTGDICLEISESNTIYMNREVVENLIKYLHKSTLGNEDLDTFVLNRVREIRSKDVFDKVYTAVVDCEIQRLVSIAQQRLAMKERIHDALESMGQQNSTEVVQNITAGIHQKIVDLLSTNKHALSVR